MGIHGGYKMGVCAGGGGHQMGVHGGHKYPSLYATSYGYSNRWQSPHKPG